EHRTVVLLEAARPLRSARRVHGADHDGGGPVASPSAGGEGGEDGTRREQTGHPSPHEGPPVHRRITSRLATACVAAGAAHVPDAQRCQPNSRPAPRSTQKTLAP